MARRVYGSDPDKLYEKAEDTKAMINYFFYPESFKDVAIGKIVTSLNDLNVAMLESDSVVERFYADGVFYDLKNTDGSNVYQQLCESEKQLAIRMLPSIARRFRVISNNIISSDVNSLKQQYPLICSLWGHLMMSKIYITYVA